MCIILYLCVEHDGAENTSVLHGGSKIISGFLMVLVRTMGEIEPGYVHAGSKKLLNHLNGPRRRSKCADDLGL